MTQGGPPSFRWMEPWRETVKRMARLLRLETLPVYDYRTLPEWAWLLGGLAGLLTHDASSLGAITAGLLAAPVGCLLAFPSGPVDGVLKASPALPATVFAGALLLVLQVLVPAWAAFHLTVWLAAW